MILGYAVFEDKKVDLEPRGTFDKMYHGFYYLKTSAEAFRDELTGGTRHPITIVPVEIED